MKTRVLTALGLFDALALAAAQTIPNPQRRSIVKSKLRFLTTALLTICAPWLSALPARAQSNNVTMSAADFQRQVYSAHLHTQLALKPELGACLQTLLEVQRRNPNADPAALANLSRQALQFYRTNEPPYIRTNGYPDEILAAYLDAFRQIPAHTNFVPVNLTMLNYFMLGAADYNFFTNYSVLDLINSADQRLSSSGGQATTRQALSDECVAIAQGNAAFAAAMDSLLLPETGVSLQDTPAEIIGNTNSPLYASPTMQTLLTLSQSSGNGSLTVSSNLLMNLFASEMQAIQDTNNANLAALAQFNQSYPDLLANLTNQAAIDANVQLQAAVLQVQPARLASASAAVLFQSKLLQQSQQSQQAVQIEEGVTSGAAVAEGIGELCLGQPKGITSLVSGGIGLFNVFTGTESPQDQMADQVSNIVTLVEDLSMNQNYRFDRVDQSLTTIYNTMNQQFSNIDVTLAHQGQTIATLNGNVYDIRNSLVTVQSSLDRIEAETFASFSTELLDQLVGPIDNDLLYRVRYPSTRGPFPEAGSPGFGGGYTADEGLFYKFALNDANDQICSPSSTSSGLDLSASALQQQLTVRPLDANLNYIQQFLTSTNLNVNTVGTYPIPLSNPQEWFIAAYAYLQLAGENPMYFRKDAPLGEVSQIISRGQNIANFCSSLALSPGTTNINWGLWNALENYYISDLTNFNSQISIIETAYAIANNFNLGAWRQWDAAAPRVTATATAVLAAPEFPPSILLLPRGAATRISAGGSFSLALKTNGTVVGWGDNTYGQTTIPAGLNNAVAIAAGGYHGLTLKANGTPVGWGGNFYGQTNIPVGLTNVVAIAAGYDFNLALKADGTVVGWGHNSRGQTNIPAGLTNMVAITAGVQHSLALKADGTVVGWGYNGDGETTIPAGLTNVVAIAAGYYHSLALKADGTVVGWGDNGYGETTIPAGLTNVVAIAAGNDFSLALKADGTVVGWGKNNFGVTNIPIGLTNAVAIAAGNSISLALKADGNVVGWGYSGSGQTTIPAGLNNAVPIAAGNYFSLALKADGTAVGWGDNGHGETTIPAGLTDAVAIAAGYDFSLALKGDGTVVGWGDSTDGQTNIPAGLINVVAIAAGDYHSLALTAYGTVVGWGYNNFGQTNIPVGLTNAVAIAAGGYHSLALKAGGTVVGWGYDFYGQTDIPAGLTNAVAIAAGYDFSLALKTDGTVVGWGNSARGRTTIPAGLTNVVAIAAGYNHSLALKADGTVVGWGDNTYGQTNIPVGLTNVVAIAAGYNHSLALKADGTLVGWGDNGASEINFPPPGLTNAVAIVAGGDFTLALKADDTVVGWGDNPYGQTTIPFGLTNVVAIAAGGDFTLTLKADGTVVGWGDDSRGQTSIPFGLTNVVAIAAGGDFGGAGSYFSLALKANGTVVGWGDNTYGQTTIPAVLTNAVAIAIAAGGYHSLALKTDGKVVGWGYNYYGETTIPFGLTNVVAIAAGNYFSLALKLDGTVVGWGDNTYGQTNIPAGATNVVAIAAGYYHGLALKADGTVVGWGYNYSGQTNIPAGLTNVVAIAAGANQSYFLTATATGGSSASVRLSFPQAEIPSEVVSLFESCNQSNINELALSGSALDNAAGELSGAKLLLTDVLELGMPYTLERDGVLHGFLYGSEPLMDSAAATTFLQTQNAQLQTSPNAPLQTLNDLAALRYLRFEERLNQSLTNLQATGQPEIPRLVGHTLRLLNLLSDAWTPPTNSPPPVLQISSQSNAPSLLLYGEPYMNYTLQYRDSLGAPGWTTTTLTNLQDQQTLIPPFSGSPQRFYRLMLPTP